MSQLPAPVEQVISATAEPGQALGYDEIAGVLAAALEDAVAGERVLVLVPDRTRNLPLAELFPVVQAALHRAARIDVMVALGTHPALPESDIRDLIGVPGGRRRLVGGDLQPRLVKPCGAPIDRHRERREVERGGGGDLAQLSRR